MQDAQKTTRKTRGKNKQKAWKKPEGSALSVMVLPLAVTDPAALAAFVDLNDPDDPKTARLDTA